MIEALLKEIKDLTRLKKVPKGFLREAVKALKEGKGPEAVDLFLAEQDSILPHEVLRGLIADIVLAVLDPSTEASVEQFSIVLRYTDIHGNTVETSDFSARSVERCVGKGVVSDIVFDVPDCTINSDLKPEV